MAVWFVHLLASLELISLCVLVVKGNTDVTSGYMSSACSQMTVSVSGSHRVESGSGLHYDTDMNCLYTVTSSSSRFKLKAIFRLFDLESKVAGTCVDYINIYDGTGIADPQLNSEPLCGREDPADILSSGRSLTLQFVTDSSASGYGFDVLFSEFASSPCQSNEFTCSNGDCIQSDLQCNNYDECGDNSDESSCSLNQLLDISNKGQVALIVGLVVGLTVLVLITTVASVYLYRRYKWRKFLRDPMPKLRQWDKVNSYPVTNKYYKAGYRNRGYQNIDSVFPPSATMSEDESDLTTQKNNQQGAVGSSESLTASGSSFSDRKIPLGDVPGDSRA